MKKGKFYGGGRIYAFHNTILQDFGGPGHSRAIGRNTGEGPFVTRNNIFHTRNESINSATSNNDFDFDLLNRGVTAKGSQEKRGLKGEPKYESYSLKKGFNLAKSSKGYDKGVRLPNFNDDFVGKAPDMGAYEAGLPPLEFGVNAYKKKPDTPRPNTLRPPINLRIEHVR